MKRFTSSDKHRFARKLREHPTATEAKLWARLRNGALGYRVRSQVVIRGWIVDFYVPELGLVIEVDGSIHTSFRRGLDNLRDQVLRGTGLRIVRLQASLVEHDIRTALQLIRAAMTLASARRPKPRGVGGGR